MNGTYFRPFRRARRQTLHQFIKMGLVALNPADPGRPPDNPRNAYRITPSALKLLHGFETEEWDRA